MKDHRLDWKTKAAGEKKALFASWVGRPFSWTTRTHQSAPSRDHLKMLFCANNNASAKLMGVECQLWSSTIADSHLLWKNISVETIPLNTNNLRNGRQKKQATSFVFTLSTVLKKSACAASLLLITYVKSVRLLLPAHAGTFGRSIHTEGVSSVFDDICVCSADRRAYAWCGNWILQTRQNTE